MAYLKSNQLSKFFNNKTISVVGNANSLLESNYGTLIDSADIVCRFNLGPKLIAPQSHGTRTDWCIYNNYSWASSANAFDITANCKWLEINYDFELVLDMEIDAYTLPQESRIKFGNDHPSIGITFLHYLTTCNPKQVNIFGFDWKFMYDRADELGCLGDFLELSRNKGALSVKKEKSIKIASGTHNLTYVEMDGTIQIDLYNHFRKSVNLGSYKLQDVGSHFIGDMVSTR